LVAAGAIDFSDAVKTSKARNLYAGSRSGRRRRDGGDFGFADLKRLKSLARKRLKTANLQPANINSPAQIVIAGNARSG
jgi:malonyl CoA-acyl carrier protein transacylase